MAQHKSSEKRIRQTKTRNALNRSKISKVRTAIKGLRGAIASKNKEEANKLLIDVQSLLAKLAKTGTIKKNNASRNTSRLASQVAKI